MKTKTYEIQAVGVSFKNPDGSSRQEVICKLYDDYYTEGLEDEIVVSVETDPQNKYDSNAVKISFEEPVQGDAGYIPRNQAAWISEALNEDRVTDVELGSMGVVKGGKVGFSIKLTVIDNRDEPDEIQSEDGETYRFDDD